MRVESATYGNTKQLGERRSASARSNDERGQPRRVQVSSHLKFGAPRYKLARPGRGLRWSVHFPVCEANLPGGDPKPVRKLTGCFARRRVRVTSGGSVTGLCL